MFYSNEDMTMYYKYKNNIVEFKSLFKKKIWAEIALKDISINDKLIIIYYPLSQKNMYDAYPKYGTVCKIKDEVNDLEDIILVNWENKYNASHGNFCIYSKGYDYKILRLVE